MPLFVQLVPHQHIARDTTSTTTLDLNRILPNLIASPRHLSSSPSHTSLNVFNFLLLFIIHPFLDPTTVSHLSSTFPSMRSSVSCPTQIILILHFLPWSMPSSLLQRQAKVLYSSNFSSKVLLMCATCWTSLFSTIQLVHTTVGFPTSTNGDTSLLLLFPV